MKELDQLVENFFQPKRDTLGLDQLVEMVEEVMNEEMYYQKPGQVEPTGPYSADRVTDDIRKKLERTLKQSGLGVDLEKLEYGGKTTIAINNVGSNVIRDKILQALGDSGWVKLPAKPAGGKHKRADTHFFDVAKNGKVTQVSILLRQGSTKDKISNIGNFMEGIVAYALAVRFVKGEDITKEDVEDFAEKHKAKSTKTPAKSGKSKKSARTIREYTEPNLEVKIGLDNITFTELDDPDKWKFADIDSAIALANSDYYKDYLDKIVSLKIDADGVSNQADTTIDVTVFGTGKDGEVYTFLDSGFSLKNLSKQLWQKGKDIFAIGGMFSNLFDVAITLPTNIEKFKKDRYPYNIAIPYFDQLFAAVEQAENAKLKGNDKAQEAFLNNFFTKLPEYATKSPEGGSIPLVALGSGGFNIYDFSRKLKPKATKKVSDKAAEKYKVHFQVTKGGPSTKKGATHKVPDKLGLYFNDKLVFQLRPKIEPSAGTFRFYLESGDPAEIKNLFAFKK
jgi:murein DD-endopeptidase MepM/ murein hydrolase activator NlpD